MGEGWTNRSVFFLAGCCKPCLLLNVSIPRLPALFAVKEMWPAGCVQTEHGQVLFPEGGGGAKAADMA